MKSNNMANEKDDADKKNLVDTVANNYLSIAKCITTAKWTGAEQIAKDFMKIIHLHVKSYIGKDIEQDNKGARPMKYKTGGDNNNNNSNTNGENNNNNSNTNGENNNNNNNQQKDDQYYINRYTRNATGMFKVKNIDSFNTDNTYFDMENKDSSGKPKQVKFIGYDNNGKPLFN